MCSGAGRRLSHTETRRHGGAKGSAAALPRGFSMVAVGARRRASQQQASGVDLHRLNGLTDSDDHTRFLEKGIRAKILPLRPFDGSHADASLLEVGLLFQLSKDTLVQVRCHIEFPSFAVTEFQQ